MIQFVCRTITDPAIFWPALEAIATVAALTFIYFEVRRLRQDAIASRVQGLRYAMEIVGSKQFYALVEQLNHTLDVSGVEKWPHDLPPIVRGLLKDLEIVASLISNHYLDEDLFLRVNGLLLGAIGERISVVETDKTTGWFERERLVYPDGRELLRKCERWRIDMRDRGAA